MYQRQVMLRSRIGFPTPTLLCVRQALSKRRRKTRPARLGSDSVYQVPPFLPYYGMTDDEQPIDVPRRIHTAVLEIPPLPNGE